MDKEETLFNIKFCALFVLFVTLFALILHLASLTPAPQNDPWGISDIYFTTIILSLIGLDKILVFVILIIVFRKKLSIHSKFGEFTLKMFPSTYLSIMFQFLFLTLIDGSPINIFDPSYIFIFLILSSLYLIELFIIYKIAESFFKAKRN